MKLNKFTVSILACTLVAGGCNSHPFIEEPPLSGKEFYPVQFCIQMEKEIVSFPATRSIPDNPIAEPEASDTDTGDPELKDLCSRIDYVVFTQEENPVLVKHRQFIADPDTDFGIVYDSLPKGNYQLYFIAHHSETAALSGNVISFENLSDTFYRALSINIGAAEEINRDITLERIVSRIEFLATDPVTNRIKECRMEIEGAARQLQLTDGTGIPSSESYSSTHTFTAEESGRQDITYAFYTFIPPSGQTLSVRLTTTGQYDEVIRERSVTGIVPERNKIIGYKGHFYSIPESDDTFQVSINNNGRWDEPVETELPD